MWESYRVSGHKQIPHHRPAESERIWPFVSGIWVFSFFRWRIWGGALIPAFISGHWRKRQHNRSEWKPMCNWLASHRRAPALRFLFPSPAKCVIANVIQIVECLQCQSLWFPLPKGGALQGGSSRGLLHANEWRKRGQWTIQLALWHQYTKATGEMTWLNKRKRSGVLYIFYFLIKTKMYKVQGTQIIYRTIRFSYNKILREL